MEHLPNSDPKDARERLEPNCEKLEAGLAARLVSIGKDCAAHLDEPFRSADHGELLYGKNGLPEDR
jgi:antitoxin VapB